MWSAWLKIGTVGNYSNHFLRQNIGSTNACCCLYNLIPRSLSNNVDGYDNTFAVSFLLVSFFSISKTVCARAIHSCDVSVGVLTERCGNAKRHSEVTNLSPVLACVAWNPRKRCFMHASQICKADRTCLMSRRFCKASISGLCCFDTTCDLCHETITATSFLAYFPSQPFATTFSHQ